MTKFKATVIAEMIYDVVEENYPANTIEEMIAIDKESLLDNPALIFDDGQTVSRITVEEYIDGTPTVDSMLRELKRHTDKAVELLKISKCPDVECVDGAIPTQIGEMEWSATQCQFCAERKFLVGDK